MLPVRLMTTRDRAFVAPTWARSSRYGLRTSASFALVNSLLAMPSVRVLCIASDERTVHAWVAGSGDALHYAYTAPELRENGFARRLVLEMFGAKGPLVLTHDAPRRLAPRARLNPYQLAGLMSEREAA